jgi:hypothetical protein
MPYNLPAPSTLDDIFKMNPGAFGQAQQMLAGGVQQNDQDLQASKLANIFNEQNNPQLVQAQGLENQFKQARIPGVQAESDMQGMNRDKQRALYDDSLNSARTKFMKEASDAHIAELENEAQRMAYSQDPEIRAKGEQLLTMSREMVQERSKQAAQQRRQLELEGARGKNAQELMRMQIEAGRFAKSPGKGAGKGGGDPFTNALNEGDPVKRHQLLQGAYIQAMEEGDEDAAYIKRLMDAAEPAAKAKLQAGGAPVYGVGPNGITQTTKAESVPSLSVPQTAPNRAARDIEQGAVFSSPEVEAKVRAKAGMPAGQLAPAAEDWVGRAMKSNPNMSREQIIEQGKKLGKF